MAPVDRAPITAVLGPTNTGKTHLALERMLEHPDGVIGFPLRLLARENYDKLRRVLGPDEVALVTGEEKIVPRRARYFSCTVEAMPVDRDVSFVAVDEIQLAADPERGHVFTERLLRARGLRETMFLGAETARPVLSRLLPHAEHVRRPRLSELTYTGPRKLTRLPPRSAVIAFSVEEVYAIAELLRRHRGGTAVVLGALSPRTRNAQVALYQEGQVDYLVATDAIGMGLNLDIDHVAFASLRKFDGDHARELTAPEFAQIAGRAGRAMRNGTFGTTADAPPLPPAAVEAIERHAFAPLGALCWRNAELDFASLEGLAASLKLAPPHPCLVRGREADDARVLAVLARRPEVAALARGRERLELLWEVCQVPDYRKLTAEAHAALLFGVFRHLTGPSGRLPAEWVERHVVEIDRPEGDVHDLVARIAGIRTWTYVTNREAWVDDARRLQAMARAVEDRLSDALHERLTQRFVDRLAATMVRRAREGREVGGALLDDGRVLVEGSFVGRVEGFRFAAEGGGGAEGCGAPSRPGSTPSPATTTRRSPGGRGASSAGAARPWRGSCARGPSCGRASRCSRAPCSRGARPSALPSGSPRGCGQRSRSNSARSSTSPAPSSRAPPAASPTSWRRASGPCRAPRPSRCSPPSRPASGPSSRRSGCTRAPSPSTSRAPRRLPRSAGGPRYGRCTTSGPSSPAPSPSRAPPRSPCRAARRPLSRSRPATGSSGAAPTASTRSRRSRARPPPSPAAGPSPRPRRGGRGSGPTNRASRRCSRNWATARGAKGPSGVTSRKRRNDGGAAGPARPALAARRALPGPRAPPGRWARRGLEAGFGGDPRPPRRHLGPARQGAAARRWPR